MNWRIYYADGSTVDNTQCAWDDAPASLIVAVVVRALDGFGRYVLNGLDFYYRAKDGAETDIYATSDPGPQQKLRGEQEGPWLKYGVGVARRKWLKILLRATKDKDFPRAKHPMRRSTDRES